jgi:hypothetical protein
MAQVLATLGDFRDTFPEFLGVVDAMVIRALGDAAGRVAPGVYTDQLTRAHCLMAAHILVTSPWGQAARLAAGNGATQFTIGQTTYSLALRQIQSERCAFIGCL